MEYKFNILDEKFSEITPKIMELTELCKQNSTIDTELYTKYKVNRGLRDLNGNGVLTGLTEISEIQAFEMVDGEKVPCEGKLFYRGIDIEDFVDGFIKENRFGFEEAAYLLIFGKLPTSSQLADFCDLLAQYRTLPTSFVRDIIMKAPTPDMMNTLARSVLTLHAYDAKANDTSLPNVLRQSLLLTAVFPQLAVYGYQTYRHYFGGDSLFIHTPKPELSTAENILHMLRPDSKYTALEAKILDVALVLHAEHGGGNNSTFTTHVVSSSGTDTYSAVAASLGSLKGPKHGGANVEVLEMIADIKKNVKDISNYKEVENYLVKILRGEANDRSGLIYGLGHAVYTVSDPRAKLLKNMAKKLAEDKDLMDDFMLCDFIENRAPYLFMEVKGTKKPMPANVDLYSGFVYNALNIPIEMATPLFACARLSGWCAHRIEELVAGGRIMRPAYQCVQPLTKYVPLAERE